MILRSTPMALGAVVAIAACDSGAEIAVVDWRSLEARVTKLEEDNAVLQAALDDKLGPDDLAGYLKDDQCPATCAADTELAEVAATIPAAPDLSGFVTTGTYQAMVDGLPDWSTFVTDGELTTRLMPYLDDAALTSRLEPYDTRAIADGKYQLKGAYALEASVETVGAALEAYKTATNTQIGALLTKTDAAAIYLRKDELSTHLTDYAKTDDLPTMPDLSPYAKKTELPNLAPYAKTADLPSWATFALKTDLPDLAPYALETELAAYAKKTDLPDMTLYALKSEVSFPNLSAYALKTDIPSLAPYALKTELPNLSLYALKTDLPNLSLYALLTDLDPYATDVDLAGIDDDLVHVLDQSVTWDVPGDFDTIEEALDAADTFSVTQGNTITLQLTDDLYVFTDYWSPVHRDGGRINIVGDTANPENVVLDFSTNGGGLHVSRGRLGLLDGVTLRGKRDATGYYAAHGVHATENGVIRLGANVVIEDFAGSCVRATFNGFVYADGVELYNCAFDGVNAVDGGVVYANNAIAEDNGRHGFSAVLGGIIDGPGIQAIDNGQMGIRAFGTSMIYAINSLATENNTHGYWASTGSAVFADNGASTKNSFHGVQANAGSVIDLVNGESKENGFGGFQANLGSTINAVNTQAVDNGHTGYQANLGSAMSAVVTESISNNGAGYSVDLGSAMDAGVQFSTGTTTRAEDNGGSGYQASTGSAMSAVGSVAKKNAGNGFGSNLGASINAGSWSNQDLTVVKVALAEENGSQGFGAWQNASINANAGIARKNGGDGFHLNQAGFLSAEWVRKPWSGQDPNGESVIATALAEDNNGNGFSSIHGSALIALAARSIDNMGQGFNAHADSFMQLYQYDVGIGAIVEGNDYGGIQADTASVIEAHGARLKDNFREGSGSQAISANSGSLIDVQGASVENSPGDAYGAWLGSIIRATNATALNVTNGNAFNAHGNSVMEAHGSTAENVPNGSGFSADNNSMLFAQNTTVTDARHGYNSYGMSLIDANDTHTFGTSGDAYLAHVGSALFARNAIADSSEATCFTARIDSLLWADDAQANQCKWQGFDINSGSLAQIHGAEAIGCGEQGFNVWGGSGITGGELVASGCGTTVHEGGWQASGFQVNSSSWLVTSDVQALNNGGDGVNVWGGSFFDSWSSNIQEGDRNRCNENGGHGISVGSGSFVNASGLEAIGNMYGGASGGSLSGLFVDYSWIEDTIAGPALTMTGQSVLSASWALLKNNKQGGVQCGGSFCTVQNSVAENNNDGTISQDENPVEFGYNVFWDGWLDVSNSTATGHDYDTNLQRESSPEDWGPIYDYTVSP